MKRLLRGAALAALPALLAALLPGCDKDDRFSLAFSHHLHVTENGIACADCHGKNAGGRFAAAGHKACAECHGDWTDAKAPGPKTCGMCHKVKDLKRLPPAAPTNAVSAARGVFLHTPALTNRCQDCHAALFDKKQKLVPELTRKETVRIRDRAHGWRLACAVCHEDMDPKTPPPDHGRNWTRRHGEAGSRPDSACGMCHGKESCRECHQTTRPASHNDLWRLKTHGLQAAWDRGRCLVCHQQDSCTACHADTRPQSHNAGWARNHCGHCHPGRGTGTGCTLCHATDIGSHPDPHSAGWRQRHCFSCHPGTPQSETCAVCHGGGSLAQIHQSVWPPVHNRLPAGVDCYLCHGR